MSEAKPISLSDQQLDTVMRACEPLPRADRPAFLEALAAMLRGQQGELGDGLVSRCCRELQAEFMRSRYPTGREALPRAPYHVTRARRAAAAD